MPISTGGTAACSANGGLSFCLVVDIGFEAFAGGRYFAGIDLLGVSEALEDEGLVEENPRLCRLREGDGAALCAFGCL